MKELFGEFNFNIEEITLNNVDCANKLLVEINSKIENININQDISRASIFYLEKLVNKCTNVNSLIYQLNKNPLIKQDLSKTYFSAYEEFSSRVFEKINRDNKVIDDANKIKKEIEKLILFSDDNIPTLQEIKNRLMDIDNLNSKISKSSVSNDRFSYDITRLKENANLFLTFYNMNHTGKVKVKVIYDDIIEVYIGEYVNGKKCGKGKLVTYDKDTNELLDTYIGQFENDYFHGKGEYELFDVGKKISGYYCQDSINFGTITYESGVVYNGVIIADEYPGKGKLTLKNGTVIEGEFSWDSDALIKQKQKYKVTYINGCKYNGELSQDFKKHGKGVFYKLNNTKLSGLFSNDYYVDPKEEKRKSVFNDYQTNIKDINLPLRIFVSLLFIGIQVFSTLLLKHFALDWYFLLSQAIIPLLLVSINTKIKMSHFTNKAYDVIERILIAAGALTTAIVIQMPIMCIIIGIIFGIVFLSAGNYIQDECSNFSVTTKMAIAISISGVTIYLARNVLPPLMEQSIWHVLWIIPLEMLISAIPVLFDSLEQYCSGVGIVNAINLLVLNIITIVTIVFNFWIVLFILLMILVAVISAGATFALTIYIQENK